MPGVAAPGEEKANEKSRKVSGKQNKTLKLNFRKRDSLKLWPRSLPLAALLASAWVRLSRSALVPVDFLRAGAAMNKSWSGPFKTGSRWGATGCHRLRLQQSSSRKVTYTESEAPVFFLKWRRRLLKTTRRTSAKTTRMQKTAIRPFFHPAIFTAESHASARHTGVLFSLSRQSWILLCKFSEGLPLIVQINEYWIKKRKYSGLSLHENQLWSPRTLWNLL